MQNFIEETEDMVIITNEKKLRAKAKKTLHDADRNHMMRQHFVEKIIHKLPAAITEILEFASIALS